MGVALNVGDRKDVMAAVDALSIPPEAVVADLGFGGGVGVALLLDRVDTRREGPRGGGIVGDAESGAPPVP